MNPTSALDTSKRLFEEARQYIPGGVNSPVRAFRSVGGDPVFFQRALGAYLYDADNKAYIDLINSWGPAILGHTHPVAVDAVKQALQQGFSFGAPTEREIDMAKIIVEATPSIDLVRMVNSGTEATMSAIRLARGYTGRSKFIKFAGCYHGHGDSFLIAAGSGAMTFGVPNSPGVTPGTAQDTLIATFNDLPGLEELVAANQGEIAAIIIEPVTGNMGVVLPEPGFLEGLRALCDDQGILLIFDEVMTGFRLGYGSAQQLLGITPDLTCLGKIIGGGMPVGAYGGRREIMENVSPSGPVYQAGTLSGNPVAMAAGYATLNYLRTHPEVYTRIEATSAALADIFTSELTAKGIPHGVQRMGSMLTLFFKEGPIRNYDEALECDTEAFARFFHHLLGHGVYLPPSQFEAMFVSLAVGDTELNKIQETCRAF